MGSRSGKSDFKKKLPCRTSKAGEEEDMLVTLPPDYRPSDSEEFMNVMQREYFRQKLLRWRQDL